MIRQMKKFLNKIKIMFISKILIDLINLFILTEHGIT